MTTLALNQLSKSYGGRKVVDSVDMTVESGQVVGLLGPNGAGKTTTFYITVGMIHPDGGTVLLDDEDITGLPMHMRSPQRGRLFTPGDLDLPKTDRERKHPGHPRNFAGHEKNATHPAGRGVAQGAGCGPPG